MDKLKTNDIIFTVICAILLSVFLLFAFAPYRAKENKNERIKEEKKQTQENYKKIIVQDLEIILYKA